MEFDAPSDELPDASLVVFAAHKKRPTRFAWTSEEDEVLLHMVSCLGQRWGNIKKVLQGRSFEAIRNRYYKLNPQWQLVENSKMSTSQLKTIQCAISIAHELCSDVISQIAVLNSESEESGSDTDDDFEEKIEVGATYEEIAALFETEA